MTLNWERILKLAAEGNLEPPKLSESQRMSGPRNCPQRPIT